jgi:hypothetical protein
VILLEDDGLAVEGLLQHGRDAVGRVRGGRHERRGLCGAAREAQQQQLVQELHLSRAALAELGATGMADVIGTLALPQPAPCVPAAASSSESQPHAH